MEELNIKAVQKILKNTYSLKSYYKFLTLSVVKSVLTSAWLTSDCPGAVRELDDRLFDFADDIWNPEFLEGRSQNFSEFYKIIVRSGFSRDLFDLDVIFKYCDELIRTAVALIKDFEIHENETLSEEDHEILDYVRTLLLIMRQAFPKKNEFGIDTMERVNIREINSFLKTFLEVEDIGSDKIKPTEDVDKSIVDRIARLIFKRGHTK